MTKAERRGQRTRESLQKALVELISERRYAAITIQDIVDRAQVGRTTFYLHYPSKDDLFMSCHETIVRDFSSGPLYPHPLSREALLSPEPSPGTIAAYRHLGEAWARLHSIFQGKDGPLIWRRIRDASAQEIEADLHAALSEADSTIPLDVLANYLAGAQIALVQWWLEKRRPLTPENLAQTFQRLQRAAIRDAFGLRNGE
jgi:AcrR family transcriptional regulator